MVRILILNGPNLNRLGKRNREIYGSTSMEQALVDIQRAFPDAYFEYRQSNHEGDLIDYLQQAMDDETGITGVVLNAGGLTHTSVSLRDAVEDAMNEGVRVVEVHISDIRARETFRRESLLTDVCAHSIIGHGINGYKEAIQWLIN
ncbi:MAG: 3-dehydroquinate dehydratase [Paludibacteraceae bacterium]|nr:3-dehydroquinate dehydratase [Paludibacteraceae bacterium]